MKEPEKSFITCFQESPEVNRTYSDWMQKIAANSSNTITYHFSGLYEDSKVLHDLISICFRVVLK